MFQVVHHIFRRFHAEKRTSEENQNGHRQVHHDITWTANHPVPDPEQGEKRKIHSQEKYTLRKIHSQGKYTLKKNTLSRKIHSQEKYTLKENTLSRRIHSQEKYTLKKNTLVCNFFHASARCLQHKQIYRPKVVVVDVVDRFPWLSSRLTALLSDAVLNGE